jgi:2,3-dihydroxybiphenyl 1,2-dioxygenase
MSVDSLGYVALNVAKLNDWQALLETVFGMQPRAREGSDAIDYRLDDYHHRFSLYPAASDGVAAVGWEVASTSKLEKLVQSLRDRQIDVAAGSGVLCAERKVKQLYSFTCPMIGVQTEVYYGPLVSHTPFVPSRGIAGYKTGALGLGHIVFWVKDLARAVKFYEEVMGFNISDYIAWDVHDAVFMHCNLRHHTLALMQDGPGPAGELMHIMVESTSLDDVGYGYDIVRERGIPVMIEPGKHSNDHMQSFYLQSPSGFWIEYGYGGREIGPDWEIRNYDQPMLWGHKVLA